MYEQGASESRRRAMYGAYLESQQERGGADLLLWEIVYACSGHGSGRGVDGASGVVVNQLASKYGNDE